MGNVIAYNFSINDYEIASADFLYGSATDHNEGNEYDLLEGNNGASVSADLFHGTGGMNTLFRNYYTGWETGKLNNLIPIRLDSYKRYYNVIGNVLGTEGITTHYQTAAPYGYGSVYALGGGNTEGTVTIPSDPMVASTIMRWGNYDVVSDSSRWEASEVPSGISKYANPVPSSRVLPSSLYLSAKPAWWSSGTPFPATGPDVTGGNIAGLGGHAFQIPACNCYLNTMGGPADGSGDPLTFNAGNCYNDTAAGVVHLRLFPGGKESFIVFISHAGTQLTIKIDNGVPPFSFALYDLKGNCVKRFNAGPSAQKSFTVTLDAKDDQGRALTPGTYLVRNIKDNYQRAYFTLL